MDFTIEFTDKGNKKSWFVNQTQFQTVTALEKNDKDIKKFKGTRAAEEEMNKLRNVGETMKVVELKIIIQ